VRGITTWRVWDPAWRRPYLFIIGCLKCGIGMMLVLAPLVYPRSLAYFELGTKLIAFGMIAVIWTLLDVLLPISAERLSQKERIAQTCNNLAIASLIINASFFRSYWLIGGTLLLLALSSFLLFLERNHRRRRD